MPLKNIKSIKPLIKNFLNTVKPHYNRHKILYNIIFALLACNYLFLFALKFFPFADLKAFRNKEVSTRIYDTQNRLVQILPLENGLRREWLDYEQIPEELIHIILCAEDKRFYFHHGADLFAFGNALRQNSKNKKTIRGASTITMQLAKMIYPSDISGTAGQRLGKKIYDIFNAWRIEAKLSKKQILELYINSIPFGSNIEGFQSAARFFYGNELSELTSKQFYSLSVIPRRPASYNPYNQPQLNAQMAYQVFLNNKKDKQILSEENLTNMALQCHNQELPKFMPHYVNYLKTNVIKQPCAEYRLGANLEIQIFSENILKKAMEMGSESRITNGAILLIENTTGNVIAWVGNSDYYDKSNGGQIDGVLVQNQPGSSMKPFLYALALEQKDNNNNPLFYPSMILPDIPMEFGNDKVYIPQNFNNHYNGPIRFRIALASSLNIPAVDLLNRIGLKKYQNLLYSLGFESLRPQAEKVDLGLSLGAGEVTLKELVPAFSVFARDGKYIPLHYEKYSSSKKQFKQIYESDTSRVICSILSDKGARSLAFGYNQTFETEYPSIFKTGTSNQYQDIVALGSTKKYTIGVWMGNFSGNTVIGKTGSSLPAWVAKQILDLLENHNSRQSVDRDFLKPEHYHQQRICTVSGLAAGPNCIATVTEYVPDGLTLGECNWHLKKNGEIITTYPAEYQKWVRINDIDINIDYKTSQLSIITPQNNSLFFYSNLYEKIQAIPVEAIGGSEETASVEYDGKLFKTINQPFYFTVPVEKGNHTLKITCGNENQEISFTVK